MSRISTTVVRGRHTAFVVVATILFFVRNIAWSAFTADPVLHNDSINYFNGYQVVIANGYDLDSIREHFGRWPEFLLPLIYYVTSFFFTIPDEESITLFHTIIFTIIYFSALLNIFYEKIRFLVYKSRYGYASKYWIVIFMSICPPGVAMQLSRQAITFAITIYVISHLYRQSKTYYPIIGAAVTTMMHVGSALNTFFISIIFSSKANPFYLLCFIIVGYIITDIDIINYIFQLNYSVFTRQGSLPLRYPMVINAIILIFIFSALLKRVKILPLLSLCLVLFKLLTDYQFFHQRVFFGLDFFVIPYVIFTFSLNALIYDVRSTRLRIKMLACLTLILSNFVPIYYLIYIRQTL